MADVLSQSEIDALLSALDSGELNPEELEKEEDKQKLNLMILKVLKSFRRII